MRWGMTWLLEILTVPAPERLRVFVVMTGVERLAGRLRAAGSMSGMVGDEDGCCRGKAYRRRLARVDDCARLPATALERGATRQAGAKPHEKGLEGYAIIFPGPG